MSVRAVYGLTGGICCLALLVLATAYIHIIGIIGIDFHFLCTCIIGLLLAVYGCLGEKSRCACLNWLNLSVRAVSC